MKLDWQIINALATAQFLFSTKRGHSILANPERLKLFLEGKENGTLKVEELVVDASLGYAGAKRGEYLALQKDSTLVGRGTPFFYELPKYKDNDKDQFTPDVAVNRWSYEDQSQYRRTSIQHLLDQDYLQEVEAVFGAESTEWSTPCYQVTPKGNGLIRLERHVRKQPESAKQREISDLLLS